MARSRRVHEENKGLTIVAKPGFQFVVFLATITVIALIILAANLLIAAYG
jgi:hypothetical protein